MFAYIFGLGSDLLDLGIPLPELSIEKVAFYQKISKSKYHFFLALTIGLLFFLGINSVEEALDVSVKNLSSN